MSAVPEPYRPVTELRPSEAARGLLKGYRMAFVERSLRGWLLRAWLFSLILFCAVLAGLLYGAWQIADWLFDATWLIWLVFLVLAVGALLMSGVITTLLSALVAPFISGPLFDQARKLCGAPNPNNEKARFFTTVGTDIRRIARFLFFSALFLPLNLIPVAGQIMYLACELGLAAQTMGWDIASHHFDLHNLDYSAQKNFIRKRRAAIFTVGVIAAANLAIPVWGILAASLNVCGAGVLSAMWDTPPLNSRSAHAHRG